MTDDAGSRDQERPSINHNPRRRPRKYEHSRWEQDKFYGWRSNPGKNGTLLTVTRLYLFFYIFIQPPKSSGGCRSGSSFKNTAASLGLVQMQITSRYVGSALQLIVAQNSKLWNIKLKSSAAGKQGRRDSELDIKPIIPSPPHLTILLNTHLLSKFLFCLN